MTEQSDVLLGVAIPLSVKGLQQKFQLGSQNRVNLYHIPLLNQQRYCCCYL
jgi:hypothetical protein